MRVPSAAPLPERLEAVRDAIRTEWSRKHQYPWVVAYSGGKDSTLLLQLVWEAILTLPDCGACRQIVVIGNDTLVESPLVVKHLRSSLDAIQRGADKAELPLLTEITAPSIDQTFWVNVVGRGYIPPTRNFRWCTDRMKIRPTTRLLQSLVRESKGTLLLIGTRRGESVSRKRRMDRRRVSPVRTNRHDSIAGCRVFAPLADLSDDDVWMTLMQRKPPWGGTHRRLLSLYRGAGGGECPLVMTKDDAPSCGTSSPRFGCWTCTVVAKDRSMRGLIDSGHKDAEAMEELFRFREWLVELRDDDRNRLPVRRDGNPRERDDGSQVFGPFTVAVRKQILEGLEALQDRLGVTLITEGEKAFVEDIWWRDEVREEARQDLNRAVRTVPEVPHALQGECR